MFLFLTYFNSNIVTFENFIEVEDLADEILVPSVNNKPNERDFSSDKINSRRNLRSRTTLKSVNRGKFLKLTSIMMILILCIII